MKNKRIICVVGTRPEAIKMAPVISALEREPWADTRILATAQHREMLDQTLSVFDIRPDVDLDIMLNNQTLPQLTSRLMIALDKVLCDEKPIAVLAQGDTTTVFMTALACYYRKIDFFHVEAGLRTGDMYYPFPEEMNRALAGRIASLHFAPTERSRENLLKEGVSKSAIHVTGNTIIDALLLMAAKNIPIGVKLNPVKRLILVTAHRRENFGKPFLKICRAIRKLADDNNDVEFLYPVHPNPNIHDVAYRELKGHPGIKLCEPLDYAPFVSAMKRAYLILSDSGGVQEEAPALGKPVLVLRDETDRPEAVDEGVVNLVGPCYERIVSSVQTLLSNRNAYKNMAKGVSPYGDGHAAERIVSAIRNFFISK